jgi:hypothetical protein
VQAKLHTPFWLAGMQVAEWQQSAGAQSESVLHSAAEELFSILTCLHSLFTHFVSNIAAMPVQKSGHCFSVFTNCLLPTKQSPVVI